jgi:hypothetical protein
MSKPSLAHLRHVGEGFNSLRGSAHDHVSALGAENSKQMEEEISELHQ